MATAGRAPRAVRAAGDDLFEEGRPVEQLDASSILSYAATKGQWPTRSACRRERVLFFFFTFASCLVSRGRLTWPHRAPTEDGRAGARRSGRDLAVVLVNEFCEDGRIYTMSVSVTDDKLPAVKGRVRAQLKARLRTAPRQCPFRLEGGVFSASAPS